MNMPWDSVTNLLKDGIDKIWPDPVEAQKAKTALIEAEQKGELAELEHRWNNAAQQLEVNKLEAQSDDLFVAGWRPFVGWTCGSAFAWNFVVQPAAVFALAAFQVETAPLPQLDLSQMMPVLLGMLGLGAYRTYEKRTGVTKAATGK
tara:strand:+ start:2167 stop:2607 length:441 start_codon:yes stop_codon:yes gene_type:complete